MSPNRNDLITSSCVSNEMLNFNRQVEKEIENL